ncbi:MAG TPA: hypothetical protein VII06_28225 [Chloroflexota bacterium]
MSNSDDGAAYEPAGGAAGQPSDTRRDHVLRTLVGDCQRVLEPLGFRLDGRGGFANANWVRFERRAGADGHRAGREVLLLAHGRQEQAPVADLYAVEGGLNVYTPRRRLVQRYGAAPAGPHGVGDMVSAIQCWWPGADAPPA